MSVYSARNGMSYEIVSSACDGMGVYSARDGMSVYSARNGMSYEIVSSTCDGMGVYSA